MYPTANLVKGWYFQVRESSPGGYIVDGTDLYGRKVSRMGADPDNLLKQCASDANEIASQLEKE